jgi:hypothetical protein
MCALYEFVKNFLKPLWENGLVSREVHKIVVKKAVEKVAGAWASNAPSTEPAISRILSDEAKNIERLVQVDHQSSSCSPFMQRSTAANYLT